MIDDIKVLVIGTDAKMPFNVKYVADVRNILGDIATFNPDLILSIGHKPSILTTKEYAIRSRWLHYNEFSDAVVEAVRTHYVNRIYGSENDEFPLISVYTGTYNTGEMLVDTYNSIREQTYRDWEWVVVDDGSTDGTYERLVEIAKLDYRVRPFRKPNNGKIGNVKDTATRLAYGKYLVELDHDDMFTDTCLEEIKKAFDANPDAGMVYTDFAEVMPDGSSHRYHGIPWEDKYKEVEYRGKKYLQTLGPDIGDGFSDRIFDRYAYFLTVGPNHARAFKADVFRQLGGYNRNFPVADDFDLFHRMYIHSKIVRVPKMLYIYRFHDLYSNTTFMRNKSIQDHLQIARNHYVLNFNLRNNQRIKADGFSYFSIVILSWNTRDLTKACVVSALESLNGNFSEVVVVDNGSTDGSVKMLKEFGNKIKLLELDDNVGFAAGCNIGAKVTSNWGVPQYHWLIFVNSDCVINKGAVQKVCNSLFYGDKIAVAGAYSNCTAFGQCPSQEMADTLPEIDVPMVPGLFLGVSKSKFVELDGFDSKLTTWEDNDFSKRIQRQGLRTVLSAGAWVHHKGHASFDKNGLSADKTQETNKPIFENLNKRIAAVCIAKNEQDAMPEWLAQWAGLVDQIVVVDTGSTDETKNIAASKGAKVVDYSVPDINDFSFADARNKAIESADADWIIMLDVDERLDERTRSSMRSFIEDHCIDIYLAKIIAHMYDGTKREVIGRPFLFRKTSDIRWVSRVHEKLIGSASQAWLTNTTINHIYKYHDQVRRSEKEPWYEILRSKEPFYTDPEYRAAIEKDFPILDWNHPDDDRIKKVHTGELVSIIMPSYNRMGMLMGAIASVISQTYSNWELIVIGDKCPIVGKVERMNRDPRIKFFNLKTNHGAGGAVPRNFGLNLARGKYIAYLDDDNIWTHNHLETLYAAIIEKNVKYAFSSFRMVEEDGSSSAEIICEEPRKFRIDTSAVMHERSLLDKYGGWKDRNEAGYAHDWEFISRWKDESWAATKRITMVYTNTAKQPIQSILNA
jgi:O-antigen biosynthesis protein